MAAKKPLIITIDVEAVPSFELCNHEEYLIWGRFGKEVVGITRMMDIAERYGHRLTFFVDFCETFLYPAAFQNISSRIVQRGHDLQLHAHMDLLPRRFWEKHNLQKWEIGLSELSCERAEILFDFLLACASEMGGVTPVAFRGGNYRFNDEILRVMKAKGIDLSFNYNVNSLHQPNNAVNLPAFRWDNGVLELPLASLEERDRYRQFDFNELFHYGLLSRLRASRHHAAYAFMDQYFQLFEQSVMVMIMHSWSFCDRDPGTGYRVLRDLKLVGHFEKFLAELPADYEIITASELHRRHQAGEVALSITRDVELMNREKYGSRGL